MQLIFAGSGSAFTTEDSNYHSNMLLINETNNAKLLIDCGSDARLSLHALGYTYKDITDVYVSHLHADHAGGLEWLALTHKFDPFSQKPNLYIYHALAKILWEKSLAAGMSTLQGEEACLDSFFYVHAVKDKGVFHWESIEFQLVQTLHVVTGFMFMPSFGLFFEINGKKIFITTDTQFAPSQLFDLYKIADLIFQDCETTQTPSGVHSHFNQLKTLPPDIKQKMWLYHYNPGALPDAIKHGFLGFVKPRQMFQL